MDQNAQNQKWSKMAQIRIDPNQEWTKSEMAEIIMDQNGPNQKWTKMDQNGSNQKWLDSEMDQIINGQNLKWT